MSNDDQTLYVVIGANPAAYLVALDSTTLASKSKVALLDPYGNAAEVSVYSTASPTIGPDGDVYYGVTDYNQGNNARGWMLHFSSDLSQTKTLGAFGWDDTASIVPASMVPSYTGTSGYLIMTKYNNYASIGTGDGMNKIAVLDPNATETDPISGVTVMKEVLTVLGPTPAHFVSGVDEWCINTAVVDPFTKSILVNSEDGKLYRWDMTTNTLTESITLDAGVSQPYTPTLIGPDGTVYAISSAKLFAVDAVTHLSISAPASSTAGSVFSTTLTAQDENNQTAASYLGTVHFTTTDTQVGVALPADYTFTTADKGVHTFTNGVALDTAGNQIITVRDTTNTRSKARSLSS